MELDSLILADAVSTPPDDKFYIHGGGFSRYEVPGLPFPVPLGVLIRLKVDDEDLHKSHQFLVAFIGPTGLPNVPPVEFVGTPPPKTTELMRIRLAPSGWFRSFVGCRGLRIL